MSWRSCAAAREQLRRQQCAESARERTRAGGPPGARPQRQLAGAREQAQGAGRRGEQLEKQLADAGEELRVARDQLRVSAVTRGSRRGPRAGAASGCSGSSPARESRRRP